MNTEILTGQDDGFTEPAECLDTEQVIAPRKEDALEEGNTPLNLLTYLIFGTLFGIVLMKSEVISWFRIQEMFRFDSFHMYGIIGSAVAVAAISVQIIKRFNLKTLHGDPIELTPKQWGRGVRYWLGGSFFGLGWALLGACPGPIFALIGGGTSVLVVALVGALAGTWTYAYARPLLPH